MKSNLWKLAFALLPALGMADAFDDIAARYRIEPDDYRRERIIAQANAPQTSNETRTITNVAPASVLIKVQQLGRILTNFAAITQQTGVNYDAIKEYALNNSADMTPAQHAMLLTCDQLWKEVREYAPNGLTNFQPVTTNTVTVTVNAPSIAEQRLGRKATGKDLE